MRRVLLTGASGRIGRAITPTLVKRFDVRFLDKQESDAIPGMIVGDIADPEVLRVAMQGIDTVIHLAAVPHEADFVAQLVPNNVVGLYHTFECAREAGVRRIIFASTVQAVAAYSSEQTIDETDLPRPSTLYGATKAFGETVGRWYRDHHGIEFLAVRIGWFNDPERARDRDIVTTQQYAREIFLTPRDAAQLFLRAVEVPTIGADGYGIVAATSRTVFERLSLNSARELLGYEPQDDIKQFVAS